MADLISELKEQLLRTAWGQVEAVMAQRAEGFPPTTVPPGEGLGAIADPGTFNTFATGYDSGTGTTVVPFMLDVSLLNGTDVLVT